MGMRSITVSCCFQHQQRGKSLAMLEARIQALPGSRCEQRSNMSHPCSTGLSQRKAARSVPIPKPAGSEDTCKSWSRTEPRSVARVGAVMDKSHYPELQEQDPGTTGAAGPSAGVSKGLLEGHLVFRAAAHPWLA